MKITKDNQNDVFKERMLMIFAITALVIMFSVVCGKLEAYRAENQQLREQIYEEF